MFKFNRLPFNNNKWVLKIWKFYEVLFHSKTLLFTNKGINLIHLYYSSIFLILLPSNIGFPCPLLLRLIFIIYRILYFFEQESLGCAGKGGGRSMIGFKNDDFKWLKNAISK